MKTNKLTIAIGTGIVILGLWMVWNALRVNKMDGDDKPATDTSQSVELVGPNWNIASVNDLAVLLGTTPYVQFGNDGRLSGSDGCNNISTAYSMDGDQLQIDPAMITTNMACEPAVMDQADLITELLLATTKYTIDGEMLNLQQADVVGLSLIASVNSLADTSWSVTSYNNGNQAVVSPILDTNLTIAFKTDGSLSGTSGCNTYFGSFQADESNLTIGGVGSTEMYCVTPEGIMDQETAFTAALPTAATWQIMGDQLWIRSAQDAIVLIASPSELNQP